MVLSFIYVALFSRNFLTIQKYDNFLYDGLKNCHKELEKWSSILSVCSFKRPKGQQKFELTFVFLEDFNNHFVHENSVFRFEIIVLIST